MTKTAKQTSAGDWTPVSWQQKTATQQAVYPDPEAVQRVVAEIARLPPLVTSWEVESLKEKLGRAARGEVFLLQGGDCAESFDECEPGLIAGKLKVLLYKAVGGDLEISARLDDVVTIDYQAIELPEVVQDEADQIMGSWERR